MGLTNCKEVLSGKATRRAAQSRRRAGCSLMPPPTWFGQSPLSPGPTLMSQGAPAIAVLTKAASRSSPPTPCKKHNGRADITKASFGRSWRCLWASLPGSSKIFSLEKQGSCALHSCGGDQWGNSETSQHSPLCSSPISALLAQSGPDTALWSYLPHALSPLTSAFSTQAIHTAFFVTFYLAHVVGKYRSETSRSRLQTCILITWFSSLKK